MGLPAIASYRLPTDDELPACVAPWRLARDRAALLIHDMQGYFVRAFPAQLSPMHALLANIDALRQQCDRAGVPVFYTVQPGRQDPAERGLQTAFWGPGMNSEGEDRDVVAALAPRSTHHVLTKWRYSAFQRTDFEAQLRARGRDQLIVTGVFAHIGCLLTAAEAFMRDIEPFVVADGVGDFSRARHDQALEYVAGRCAVPITTARVLHALNDHER